MENIRPPTRSRASITATLAPARTSARAAVNPDAPASRRLDARRRTLAPRPVTSRKRNLGSIVQSIASMDLLLLEDDDAFAESLREVLGESGARSVRARTVVEARRALSARKFDVVLVDLDLGEGAEARGRHLLDDLAQLAGMPPMLIVSGAVEAPRVAAEFGIGLVRKPFEMDHLFAAIHAAVQHGLRPIRSPHASGTLRSVVTSPSTSTSTEEREHEDPDDRGGDASKRG